MLCFGQETTIKYSFKIFFYLEAGNIYWLVIPACRLMMHLIPKQYLIHVLTP